MATIGMAKLGRRKYTRDEQKEITDLLREGYTNHETAELLCAKLGRTHQAVYGEACLLRSMKGIGKAAEIRAIQRLIQQKQTVQALEDSSPTQEINTSRISLIPHIKESPYETPVSNKEYTITQNADGFTYKGHPSKVNLYNDHLEIYF